MTLDEIYYTLMELIINERVITLLMTGKLYDQLQAVGYLKSIEKYIYLLIPNAFSQDVANMDYHEVAYHRFDEPWFTDVDLRKYVS